MCLERGTESAFMMITAGARVKRLSIGSRSHPIDVQAKNHVRWQRYAEVEEARDTRR